MENRTAIPQRDDSPYPEIQIEETDTELRILISDIQLHTTIPRKPKNFVEGVRKFLKTGKAWRTHQGLKPSTNSSGTLEFSLQAEGLDKVIAHAKALGKRVQFYMPEGGVPIVIGKDLLERLKARNTK